MPKTYHKVLTIAGSDSGGGAGIQADLKTFSAIGCYGMSVITALTAQNTTGVTAIHPVPVDFVEDQMAAIFSDMGADAVKIGMLYSVPLIETVSRVLKTYQARNVVFDPVMVAQSGDKLLEDDAVDAMKTHLLPMADLVTPNIPEASILLNRTINGPEGVEDAIVSFGALGCRNVLIKGGHLEDDTGTDWLYLGHEKHLIRLIEQRINTRNNHGTGCTLSSAVASYLAKGQSLEPAVRSAKSFITKALSAGSDYTIGHGHGPVHHFFQFW